MFWGSKPTKDNLQGHKNVVVHGQRFTIRRINPLLDFPNGQIPQMFSTFAPLPPPDDGPALETHAKKTMAHMMVVVEVGVVEPALVPVGKGDLRGKESGLTTEDLFRDPEVGRDLYLAILEHSLFRLKGWKRPFFWLANRAWRYTHWQRIMDSLQAPSPSVKEMQA